MFLSARRYFGFLYRQQGERLEALVATVQHAGTVVPLVLLVPIIIHHGLNCFFQINIIITCLYNAKLY